MIKTTLGALFVLDQAQAFPAILSQPRTALGFKTTYQAGKLARAHLKHIVFLNAQRDALIKEFGAPRDTDGVCQVTTPEQFAKFNPEHEKLLSTEVEIDLNPLTRIELRAADKISEGQLMSLEDAGMLIDGEEPAAANDPGLPAT